MYTKQTFTSEQRSAIYFSKKSKKIKSNQSFFVDRLNLLIKDSKSLSSEQLFQTFKELALQYINFSNQQLPKNLNFFDILKNGILLGVNFSNKNLIFFTAKLTQIFVKCQLNISRVAGSLQPLTQYHLIEKSFEDYFFISPLIMKNTKDDKFKNVIEKVIAYTLRFVQIDESEKQSQYLKRYLNEAIQAQSFMIYHAIIISYYEKLLTKPCKNLCIHLNKVMKVFLEFKERYQQQHLRKYEEVIFKYSQLFQSVTYLSYLAQDFQSTIQSIGSYIKQVPNKTNENSLICIYIYLTKHGAGRKCSLKPFLNDIQGIKFDTVNKKGDFYLKILSEQFYEWQTLNFASFKLYDLNQLSKLHNILSQNIDDLIISDSNFIIVIDQLVFNIQKLKSVFKACLKENFKSVLYCFYKLEQQFTSIQKWIQIQKVLLFNKHYLANDNFKNAQYLINCGVLEFMIELVKSSDSSSYLSCLSLLKKWIKIIDNLNIEKKQIQKFYNQIIIVITRVLINGWQSDKRQITLRCYEQVFITMPPEVLMSQQALNTISHILGIIKEFLSQKALQDQTQSQYNEEELIILEFSNNFSHLLIKKVFSLFKINPSLLHQNDVQNLLFFQFRDLICESVMLFSDIYRYLEENQRIKFPKLLSQSMLMFNHQNYFNRIKEAILKQLESNILISITDSKNTPKKVLMNNIQSFMEIYTMIININQIPREVQVNKVIYQKLKRVNFFMNFKRKIFNNLGYNQKWIQKIDKFQQIVLGSISHQYIDELIQCDRINKEVKENNLQLYLNVLVKKVYLISHPQLKNFDSFYNYSIKKAKTIQNQLNSSTQQQLKSKRELKNGQQRYFIENVLNFQDTCFTLSKIKNTLTQGFEYIMKIVQSYKTSKVKNLKFEILGLSQGQIDSFIDVPSLLGFTWNLVCIFKLLDLQQKRMEILKIRLGIFNYFSKKLSNQTILQFQIDKLIFFELLEQKQAITSVNNTKTAKSLEHRLILNEIGEKDMTSKSTRLERIVYLLNNTTSTKNFSIVMRQVSCYFLKGDQTQKTVIKANIKLFPSHHDDTEKYNGEHLDTYFRKDSQAFRQSQISYPLLTLVYRRFLYYVKKYGQLSQMKSILNTITSYFSKTGLGVYYEEIIEIWLKKNIQINILKVIDCYKILVDDSGQNNVLNSQNVQKTKIFSKVDRMICNKRRTMSNHFSFKTITDLMIAIKDSNMLMHKNINKILMFQFKQHYTLYLYEAHSIIKAIYPQQDLYEDQKQFAQIFKQLDDLSKIALKKESFRDLTAQNLDIALEYLRFISDSISKIIIVSYQKAQLAQSVAGFFIEFIQDFTVQVISAQKLKQAHKIIDDLIIKLALNMIEFHYEFKNFVYKSCEIRKIFKGQFSETWKFYEQNKLQLKSFQQNFQASINEKIFFLKTFQDPKKRMQVNSLKHPLSIIYPLRNWVYNIAVLKDTIVTKVNIFSFNHSLTKIDQFIQKNCDVLFKQKSFRNWSNIRISLDRQLAKITQNTDIGLFDLDIQHNFVFKSHNHKKYTKFIYEDSRTIKTHFQQLLDKQGISVKQQSSIKQELQKLKQNVMINYELSNNGVSINQNLLILTVNRLSIFPFQRVKSAEKYQGVYRVPSVKYIMQQQKQRQNSSSTFNIKRITYVVNPQNNLPDTEKRFYQMKQTIENKSNSYLAWQGLTNKKPTKQEFDELFSKDIYIYMGHGNGMGHIREMEFYNQTINCLTMLFGCSSLDMDHLASQMHGYPLIILNNNCPGMLGSLWEVTDKDTDMLTLKILQTVLHYKEIDFSLCLRQARKQIKMQYCNGSAFIIYGLPTTLVYE